MQRRLDIQFFSLFYDAKSYKKSYFAKDLFSAFIVAMLAIPQSIAYAMLAGLPPIAGLYCAIFGTLFCSCLCSSRHLISGPTTAMAILLQASIADIVTGYYGTNASEEASLYVLMHLVLLIGVLQIFASLLNVEKVLRFISKSVILGYFAGLGIAILISQLFPLFGISSLKGDQSLIVKAFYLLLHIKVLSIESIILGVVSLAMLLFFRKKFPRLPGSFLMVVVASLLALLPFFKNVSRLSLDGINSLVPDLVFPFSDVSLFIEIFPAASAIALLGIFEVFSVTRAFGAKSGQSVHFNQEIYSIGFTNLFLSFIFPSLAASASTTRTLVNFTSGGKTRFAALLSSLFVVLGIWLAFPLISYIPQTSLAAILIATVVVIVDFDQIKMSIKATRGDFLAFSLTFISCFFFRLDIAFYIGIIISIIFYLKKAAEPHLVEYAFNTKGRLITVSSKEKRRVRIIGYSGELFFGVADFFQKTLQKVAEDHSVKVIVLRLNGVFHVDASICFTLLDLYEYLQVTNRHLVITGVSDEVLEVFKKASIYQKIGENNIFLTDDIQPQFSTWRGCLRASELLSTKSSSQKN